MYMYFRFVSIVATCVKGITAVGNSICIGSHEGHILVFSLREEGEVEYKQQLEGHNAPLSCLDSSRDGRVASGDEVGVVRVWKDPVRNKESKVIYSESKYASINFVKSHFQAYNKNGVVKITVDMCVICLCVKLIN